MISYIPLDYFRGRSRIADQESQAKVTRTHSIAVQQLKSD